MSKAKARDFECTVVNETVRIELRGRRSVGLTKVEGYFIQCDQLECQYVSENCPPCPLSPDMFTEEIAEQEERKRLLRETRER